MKRDVRTTVAIVGAGPTGLLLAGDLARGRRGRDCAGAPRQRVQPDPGVRRPRPDARAPRRPGAGRRGRRRRRPDRAAQPLRPPEDRPVDPADAVPVPPDHPAVQRRAGAREEGDGGRCPHRAWRRGDGAAPGRGRRGADRRRRHRPRGLRGRRRRDTQRRPERARAAVPRQVGAQIDHARRRAAGPRPRWTCSRSTRSATRSRSSRPSATGGTASSPGTGATSSPTPHP